MPFKALMSHYLYYPWQTLFLLTGLVAGVALWSAVQLISEHARVGYADADRIFGAEVAWQVQSATADELPFEEYVRLRRAGFRELIPVLEEAVVTAEGRLVELIGTDLLALGLGPGEENGADGIGEQLSGAAWLDFVSPPWQTWADPVLAKSLGLRAGEQLPLGDERRLPPLRILDTRAAGARLLLDLGALQQLFDRAGLDYLVAPQLDDDRLAELRAVLPDTLLLEAASRSLDLGQLTRSLHIHLSALSLLCFAVGLFMVANAVHFSLGFRRPTLFALGLLGVGPVRLAGWLLLETLLLGTLAWALGLLLGERLARLLLPGFATSVGALYEAPVSLELLLRPRTLLLALLLAWGGLLFALVPPLLGQARRSLAELRLSPQVWRDDRRLRLGFIFVSSCAVPASLLLWRQAPGVLTGFLLLGSCLLSAACLLPEILFLLLAAARRATGDGFGKLLLLRWLLADGEAQLPWLRTAMLALLLALTTNLGVETLTGSFRPAFLDWLDKRLSADVQVPAGNLDPADFALAGRRDGWLDSLHAPLRLELRWRDRPLQLRGVDPFAPDIVGLPLASPKDISAALLLTEAAARLPVPALANEQLRYLAGVAPGEELELPTRDGVLRVRVVGFFHDYGNTRAQLYLAQEVVRDFWPRATATGFSLWLHREAAGNPEMVEAALRAAGAERWFWQRDIRLRAREIFERTFTITAALNSLTLLVAGLAMAVSLFTLVRIRGAELALWRALGVTGVGQSAVLLCSMGGFLLAVWLLSLPLGYLVGRLLVHELNQVSFGWTMPLVWSLEPAFRLLLLLCLLLLLMLPFIVKLRPARGLAELSARGAVP